MMSVYSRKQFGDRLTADLATATLTGYKVVPDPRAIDLDDPSIRCVLQIVRQRIVPSPENPRGGFGETHELWVVTSVTDPDLVEDALDDRLAEVIEILDEIPFITWSSAERRIHGSNRHAFMISIQLETQKEESDD